VLFPRSNAADLPHYLNRIFRYSLPSLSLVTEATGCLSVLLASCLGGDTHALQTSSYGRKYTTAALSLGTCTVQAVQNTKYVIFVKVFSVLFSIERKSYVPLLWYGSAVLVILENTPLLTAWLTKLTCELHNCTHESNHPTTGINVDRYPNAEQN